MEELATEDEERLAEETEMVVGQSRLGVPFAVAKVLLLRGERRDREESSRVKEACGVSVVGFVVCLDFGETDSGSGV